MKRRTRRAVDIFNLSFLDVVSCGFGAIILLLVIVKVSEPHVIEQLAVDLSGLVERLEAELHRIRGDTTVLNRDLSERQEQLSAQRDKLARLKGDLSSVRGEYRATRNEHEAQTKIEKQLESAQQTLTEEMKRLAGAGYRRPASSAIGGVPVDSEYIIFIIDTSGSMNQNAWPLVRKKVREVLAIYPRVKGIQVMNDMGDYMYSQYKGKWIPDTPARRKAINKRLANWLPFSNSSPVEGIEAAIRRFYARDKRISLYVFGDDFSRGSIQTVIDTVAKLNRADKSGQRRVRIHAVGFPVLFREGGLSVNAVRYAALMRKLAEENGGSFVGLNKVRP
ncbi:MAG: VWA domain-containing protein [Gammaproteobacteria bacterium]|nr:MAG: VWA domain-containing protein [Gammaproteobacteria bacterium]